MLTLKTQEGEALGDVANFITTLEVSPAFQSDVAALVPILPSSILQAGQSDPEDLFADLATDQAASSLPAYVSAFPTPVLESLETLAAKPLKAVDDVDAYIEQLIAEPDISSVIGVLMTAVPTSVQQAFESDPVQFVANIVTATALPPWVTGIPAPLQSDIGSVVNEGLSIIAADFEGKTATPSSSANGTSKVSYPSSKYPMPTATGSVLAYNSSHGATGSPIAFLGAAVPMRTAAAGAVALLAGVGVLLNV